VLRSYSYRDATVVIVGLDGRILTEDSEVDE
jgi:hypothetical protein